MDSDIQEYLDWIRRQTQIPGGVMNRPMTLGYAPVGDPGPGLLPPATDTRPDPGVKTVRTTQEPPQPTAQPRPDYGPPPSYPMPPAPHLTNIPDPYGGGRGAMDERQGGMQREENPFQVFTNPIVALSIVGSLFTRRPLINAMMAAGGALKGYNERQDDIYQRGKELFHEQLEAAQAQNNLELKNYEVQLERTKIEGWNKVMPDLWAEAVKGNDKFMQNAIKLGPEFAEKAYMDRQRIKDQIEKAYEAETARSEAKDEEAKRLESDPGVKKYADDIYHYRRPNISGTRDAPYDRAVRNVLGDLEARYGPYDQTEFGAKNKFVTGLGGTIAGSSGGQINSAKIVVRHLATLDRLADDLKSDFNSTTFRRASQALQIEFGQPAPTNFDAAVSMVSGEIVKLIEGAGGGEGDRNKVSSAFDRSHSTKSIHEAVDVAREVMSARVTSLAEQAKAAHAEDIFNRFLPPDIAKELEPRRESGAGFDVEAFKVEARKEGWSEDKINEFLKGKGH